MVTYNFYCINDSCNGPKTLIKINLEEEDSENDMFCDVCSVKLKKVGKQAFTVMGSKAEQYIQQSNYLKQRSKDHAKTPESRALRKKVMDTQFGVMGMEKTEKRKK